MNQEDNKVTEESLTLDYNDLYKLESSDEPTKTELNPNDILFEKEDHIEDETMVRKQEIADTKKNLTFMIVIVIILIVIILFLFPIIFKLINK